MRQTGGVIVIVMSVGALIVEFLVYMREFHRCPSDLMQFAGVEFVLWAGMHLCTILPARMRLWHYLNFSLDVNAAI